MSQQCSVDSHGCFDAVLRSILCCGSIYIHTKMIQDACITRKKRKAKKDPFGTFVSFCPSSALHLVHSNLRTIFLVVLACVQAVPRNIWGYWGHPSGRQEFHFFTDFSISQGKLFAFLWNTGLVWPPKPACTRQRVTFCNSKKPKQEVSQRTAVKANERNFMSVFQTFQTFSNSVLDNAARLLLVVSSLSLCAQRSFASLVLRHLRLSGEAHMVASRQSFPVVARERCLQTICHCVRYPCLVGSVLPALSAVGVARLRDVDHDPGTRLTAQSQFLLGFKGLISRHELIQIQSVPRPNLVDSMKVAAVCTPWAKCCQDVMRIHVGSLL